MRFSKLNQKALIFARMDDRNLKCYVSPIKSLVRSKVNKGRHTFLQQDYLCKHVINPCKNGGFY